MEKYLYDDLYQVEEKHWWHIAKRATCIQYIKKFSPIKKPKILDIGCGTGKNVEEFEKFGDAFGIDISSDAIAYCKKRGLKNVFLGSSDKTKFKTKEFQVVTLLDVLEHVEEKPTLHEISRVLSDDGFVIITVPAFSLLWSTWDEVLHHKRRYTNKTLKKVLRQNGFKVIQISYLYSFLVVPAWLVRFFKSVLYKNTYPSDFQLSHPFINSFLGMLSSIERGCMQFFSIPFGTSLVCVAKKDGKHT